MEVFEQNSLEFNKTWEDPMVAKLKVFKLVQLVKSLFFFVNLNLNDEMDVDSGWKYITSAYLECLYVRR